MKTSPISSNNQINFTSAIKWTNEVGFTKELEKLSSKLLVDYPFTRKEISRGQEVYTQGVRTCTAGGVVVKTKEGRREIVMFHLDPNDRKNNNFRRIKKSILRKIGNDTPVNGFILGSKAMYSKSANLFNLLEEFIQTLKIPYSKFRGTPWDSSLFDLAYNGKKDEFSASLSSANILGADFFEKRLVPKIEEIVISPTDHIFLDEAALYKAPSYLGSNQ